MQISKGIVKKISTSCLFYLHVHRIPRPHIQCTLHEHVHVIVHVCSQQIQDSCICIYMYMYNHKSHTVQVTKSHYKVYCTQVKVVHDVCLEYVFELDKLGAVWIVEQWVISVSAKNILIYMYMSWRGSIVY